MASPAIGSAARSGFEEHRKPVSLLFYRAVRDLKPVWMLEDMRAMEAFCREEGDAAAAAGRRTYTPSEALLYAIVHDHRAYARYLLGRYVDEALARPGESFCRCASPAAPHLAMAVRYDRPYILGLILQESLRIAGVPSPPSSSPSSSSMSGCFHMEDGRTPLHLACELLRPEAAVMLLGSGASPHAPDRDGCTPLDVLLEKLGGHRGQGETSGSGRQCLDHLLMFMPKVRFKMKGALRREPGRWARVLGEETYGYLVERRPAPLILAAMQTVLRQLSPATFSDSLHELPIPSSLKPL
ncbi:ankyrin repeat domain-containing protein 9 [Pungitius pungitius]|uniref:ankyrin repeat domain-containing protein 9 n=1 Tax=Pungitius pungitius TaxID=134920 RepID=UPI002E115CAC